MNSYALFFNGNNNYVVVDSSDSIESIRSTNISLALWIKHTEDTNSAYGGIIQGPYGDGYSEGFRILDYHNKPLVEINLGDILPRLILGNPFEKDKWCHIAFTYDHRSIKLYQNGELVQTTPETRDIKWADYNSDFYIGLAQWYFKGAIDDVILYNYALAPSQIKKLYNKKR